MGFRHIIR